MSKLHELNDLGQSIWYDNIRRALLDSGELAGLIDDGITGVTSNPTIFEKAILGSTDYDQALHGLVDLNMAVPDIYERLALADIGRAAELLEPVHQQTAGKDGFVSVEVSPTLAYDSEGTVLEARRLFVELDRPNIMIKVPATEAGVRAMQILIAEGISINATLIFGLARYRQVAEAYLLGLEQRVRRGESIEAVASVASFFISRVDSAVDRTLNRIGVGSAAATNLLGRIAIANAKQAYQHFRALLSSERWQHLQEHGASPQRLLWASTGTKNPHYPDTWYMDALIGPDTVNTVPPDTLQAFMDHGEVAETLERDLDQAQADLQALSGLGVDLHEITEELLEEGVVGFAGSFQALMEAIAEKRERLLAGWQPLELDLGALAEPVRSAVEAVQRERILPRIWQRDHTVWDPDPAEIENRLGWLTTAEVMLENLHRISSLTDGVRADGYQQLVLLGMGGSSLAAEVFHRSFGVRQGFLSFQLLDSTDPQAVLELDRSIDYARVLFIVATKSGGTVETLSFFKYFYHRLIEEQGAADAGPHFVAITDPGSGLAELAERYDFRATFLNDPEIGGRYSALSYFGLVPAALIGVELEPLLERARAAACGSDFCVEAENSPAAWLGCAMAELAKAGRDKLTLIASPQIESFGGWIEQLVAESTGKEGTGVLPVIGEQLESPDRYADDRVFVQLMLDGASVEEAEPSDLPAQPDANGRFADVAPATVDHLAHAGHPLIRLRMHDLQDLGGQFFLWEMATAIAGHRLGIQPFDQPNVEAAKQLALEMVDRYIQDGKLVLELPSIRDDGVELYGAVEGDGLEAALRGFLAAAEPGSYLAIQAFLAPGAEHTELLEQVRQQLGRRSQLATTLGYGPRYLHSTGQLHKGDAGRGLFLQITSDDSADAEIPDEPGQAGSSLSFGVLKAAQAQGDQQALLQAGRVVMRVHLRDSVGSGLRRLHAAIESL